MSKLCIVHHLVQRHVQIKADRLSIGVLRMHMYDCAVNRVRFSYTSINALSKLQF